MNDRLLVKRLHPDAKLPERGSPGSAGLDVSACFTPGVDAEGDVITIKPWTRQLIRTGLAMRAPDGTYIKAGPRSGLALKNGIHVMAGIIDIDYTGEVGILLVNLSDEDFQISPGDRIAQLILHQISYAPAEWAEDLPGTERGAGGFGSTGVQ